MIGTGIRLDLRAESLREKARDRRILANRSTSTKRLLKTKE